MRLAAAILAAAVGLAYANSGRGGFVLDDQGTVLDNRSLGSWRTAFLPPNTGIPVSGRPLTNATFALNHALSGTAPFGYHLVNVAIHLGAVWLLFGIVRRLWSDRGALAVALLWAVHPLTTAAVSYVSQRAEELMGVCLLATLYAFARSIEPSANECRRRGWRWGSWFACLAGMACKEVMVVAPFLVVAYDVCFVAPGWKAAWQARRGYYLALASTWLFLACLVAGSGSRGGTAGFASGVGWKAYAWDQVWAIPHYLRLAWWPAGQVADYGRSLSVAPAIWWGDAGLLAALLAGTIWLLVRRSRWGFAGAWFFLILAPSSSVVPVATELVAEHRMYLPLIAVVAAFVAGGDRLFSRWRFRKGDRLFWRWRWVATAALAAALAVATVQRNRVYGSVDAFWTDVVLKRPDNSGAWNNLGNAWAAANNLSGAQTAYDAALRLRPDYADALGDRGGVRLRSGDLTGAAGDFAAALRVRPQEEAWRRALGLCAYRLGQQRVAANDLNGAESDYETAVTLEPGDPDAHAEFGNVLAQLGRAGDAEREYRAALRLAPRMADVHNNLGGLLAQAGRWTEADQEFARALEIQPDYREARDNLARVHEIQAKLGR